MKKYFPLDKDKIKYTHIYICVCSFSQAISQYSVNEELGGINTGLLMFYSALIHINISTIERFICYLDIRFCYATILIVRSSKGASRRPMTPVGIGKVHSYIHKVESFPSRSQVARIDASLLRLIGTSLLDTFPYASFPSSSFSSSSSDKLSFPISKCIMGDTTSTVVTNSPLNFTTTRYLLLHIDKESITLREVKKKKRKKLR